MNVKNSSVIITLNIKLSNSLSTRIPFVMGYWIQKIELYGEKKERYRFLNQDNIIRIQLEKIFNVYEVDTGYRRFIDTSKRLSLKKIKGIKYRDSENKMVFWGLKKIEKPMESKALDFLKIEQNKNNIEKVRALLRLKLVA